MRRRATHKASDKASVNDQCWTGRCVNSVEQHQALRHLKWVASDRSLHGSCVPTVPSSHGSSTFDTCNAFSASENEIQQIKKAVKQSRGGLDHLVQVLRPENVILIDCAAVLRTQHLVGAT